LVSVAGRLVLVCSALLAFGAGVARGEGNYQSTRDGKTLVWNNYPRPGDVATWSGDRDGDDYARGFGRLVWYTTEPGADKPRLYARYWGRMVNGKLEGPVNVHSKKKTHYAIFIDGVRVTGWRPGTAPVRATDQWRMLVAKQGRTNAAPTVLEQERREPEAPAAGPAEEIAAAGDRGGLSSQPPESIQDLYTDRWPKIDVDDSLRLLVFPPRTLR
jgi:hypothetical protein